MRLLLDENLPKRLKLDFAEHEVFTVRERQWNGIKNGQLLKLLIENHFDALLTFDKNLQYQQNFSKYTITVFVLTAKINQYSELTKITSKVKKYLNRGEMPAGVVIIRDDCYQVVSIAFLQWNFKHSKQVLNYNLNPKFYPIKEAYNSVHKIPSINFDLFKT